MLARQRQEAILRGVEDDGGVRVSELVEKLGVSDMTVRRDIEFLAGKGLVLKVHGGATLPGDVRPTVGESGFAAKLTDLQVRAKILEVLEYRALAAMSSPLIRCSMRCWTTVLPDQNDALGNVFAR